MSTTAAAAPAAAENTAATQQPTAAEARRTAMEARVATQKRDVVHLFSYPRGPCLNLSPPCLKLEAYLRMTSTPYVMHYTMSAESVSATERLPYAEINGEGVADSQFIIERVQDVFKLDKDEGLSKEQRAKGHAIRRVIETSAYFGIERSMMVDNLAAVGDVWAPLFGPMPRATLDGILAEMRQGVITALNNQGNGDLTDAQYHAEWVKDLSAVETLIGDSDFALGNKPTSVDAAIFGSLDVTRALGELTGNTQPAVKFIRDSAVLSAYLARVEAVCFPDAKAVIAAAAAGPMDDQAFVA